MRMNASDVVSLMPCCRGVGTVLNAGCWSKPSAARGSDLFAATEARGVQRSYGWYRRLRCALVWLGGESGISSPNVLAGRARATMRSASGEMGGRGVSRLSRRGRRGGRAAGMAGKCTSGSQSSGVGAGAQGILGLRDCSGGGAENEPQRACRSDVDEEALDTLPLLQAERYPFGVPEEEMRFISEGGVRAGRMGIWKCSACGAEMAGERPRIGERRAGEGDTSFDMFVKKSLRRRREGGAGLRGGDSRQTTATICDGVGGWVSG